MKIKYYRTPGGTIIRQRPTDPYDQGSYWNDAIKQWSFTFIPLDTGDKWLFPEVSEAEAFIEIL